jgi:hypothetical protein
VRPPLPRTRGESRRAGQGQARRREGCVAAGGGVLPRVRALRRPRHLLLPPQRAEELRAADSQLDLRPGPPLPLIFVCLSLQVFLDVSMFDFACCKG